MRRSSRLAAVLCAVLTAGGGAACGAGEPLDPFCEGRAGRALDRLERAALPHLDGVRSVDRLDGCDSGDAPFLDITFRAGMRKEAASARLVRSPWRAASANVRADFADLTGDLVYETSFDTHALVLVVSDRDAWAGAGGVGVFYRGDRY